VVLPVMKVENKKINPMADFAFSSESDSDEKIVDLQAT
jgi:hypothetical protein